MSIIEIFPTQLTLQWSMKIITMLWCRFQQCLCTCVMLLVETSSETGPFRYLSNHVFGVGKFGNIKAMSIIFCSKCLKFNIEFKNESETSEKVFSFWDNSIWIGIVKLSLLRTGYFSSAANVLRSSPKISHVNQRDFFRINCLGSDQLIW